MDIIEFFKNIIDAIFGERAKEKLKEYMDDYGEKAKENRLYTYDDDE